MNTAKLQQLRDELEQVRQLSLQATRRGNYLQVGRLTRRTAELNHEIARIRSESQPVFALPGLSW